MDSKEILLKYFNVFKSLEDSKEINKYLDILNKSQYIDKFDFIEELIKKVDISIVLEYLKKQIDEQNGPSYINDIYNNFNKGLDYVLVDIFNNIGKYNASLKKVKDKTIDYNVNKDITFEEINIELKDILKYLEVNEEELDKKLLFDLNKFGDINNLKDMASEIKTDLGIGYVLYDKISDKNTLLSILLHSNMTIIKNVCTVCKNRGLNLNKFLGEPSIFVNKTINSKCKYQVPVGYNNFIQNIELCINNNIDLKRMSNGHSVFFINDYNSNKNNIEQLIGKNVIIKHVLENVGGIFTTNFKLVLNNIDILRMYGIELTDDNCNNGYTILGMSDLAEKLDYHIEKGLWKKSDGKALDNMDLTKGLRIKDNYMKWKNKYKNENQDNELKNKFSDNGFSEEKLNILFQKKPELKSIIDVLDSKYLVSEEGYYLVNSNIISKYRLLRNICNYKELGDSKAILINSLKFNSNVNIEEIIKVLEVELEKGDESVKLSKGL